MTSLSRLALPEDCKQRTGVLPYLGELARQFLNIPSLNMPGDRRDLPEDPRDQLAALYRAEARAKTEIRAVLERFAGEVGVLRNAVDDAMFSVEDTLDELACEIERGFVEEIEDRDR